MAALEDKYNAQAERIIEIKAIMDGQTVLTNATNYDASAVSMGYRKELTDMRAMMKQLDDLVTTQDSTVETLSIKINTIIGRGTGWNTDKKKVRPGLHVYLHCKREM